MQRLEVNILSKIEVLAAAIDRRARDGLYSTGSKYFDSSPSRKTEATPFSYNLASEHGGDVAEYTPPPPLSWGGSRSSSYRKKLEIEKLHKTHQYWSQQ